jgi:hypothetical protein
VVAKKGAKALVTPESFSGDVEFIVDFRNEEAGVKNEVLVGAKSIFVEAD